VSKKEHTYCLFDTDVDQYYPINLSELPFVDSISIISGNLMTTVKFVFVKNDITAETLLTKTSVHLYLNITDHTGTTNTLMWEGKLVHSSILAKNNQVEITCRNKMADFLEMKVDKSGDRIEITSLIKSILDDNGVSYDWNYTKPTKTDLYKLAFITGYGGDDNLIKQDINDAVQYRPTPGSGSSYMFISLQKSVIRLKCDYAKEIIRIDTVLTTDKKLGRFIKTDIGEYDYGHLYVECIATGRSIGTLGTRYEHLAGIYHIDAILTSSPTTRLLWFSKKHDGSYTDSDNRDINNFEADKSGYVLPNTIFHYYDSENMTRYFVGAMHWISTEWGSISNEIRYCKFKLRDFTADYDDMVLGLFTTVNFPLDPIAYLVPACVNNKILYYKQIADEWGEIDYINDIQTANIGYAPVASVKSLRHFAYFNNDWHMTTGTKLYKVTRVTAWVFTLISSDCNTLTEFGYGNGSFNMALYVKGSYYNADVYYCKWGDYQIVKLVSYKNRLFIFFYGGDSNLYFTSDINNANLLDVLKMACLPLGMIIRYDYETDLHTIDSSYIDLSTVEKKEYMDEFVDDIVVEGHYREVSKNQEGQKYMVIRNIDGDWECYIEALLAWWGAKKIQYSFTMSGMYTWKAWDRAVYNGAVYRIANISMDRKHKTTSLRIIRE
jgi:hypothetical protein